MTDPQPLIATLERNSHRVTRPRRTVASLVVDQPGPFTAADLMAHPRARRDGLGRATVFRALDLFVELGLLERLDLPTGEHAYVPCQPAHHHHLVCSSCGRSTDIKDDGLREVVDGIASRTGYRIDEHRLELYGSCPACRRAQPACRRAQAERS